MSAVKERIFGAITIMTDADAEKVWSLIKGQFPYDWDNIETITPDDWDKEMLDGIATDPDCHVFVSAESVMSELGI